MRALTGRRVCRMPRPLGMRASRSVSSRSFKPLCNAESPMTTACSKVAAMAHCSTVRDKFVILTRPAPGTSRSTISTSSRLAKWMATSCAVRETAPSYAAVTWINGELFLVPGFPVPPFVHGDEYAPALSVQQSPAEPFPEGNCVDPCLHELAGGDNIRIPRPATVE